MLRIPPESRFVRTPKRMKDQRSVLLIVIASLQASLVPHFSSLTSTVPGQQLDANHLGFYIVNFNSWNLCIQVLLALAPTMLFQGYNASVVPL